MKLFNKKERETRFVLLFSFLQMLIVRKIVAVNISAKKSDKSPAGQFLICSMMIAAGVILTGCQSIRSERMSSYSGAKKELAVNVQDSSRSVNAVQPVIKTEGPVEQCQRELIALGKINAAMYEKRRVAFSGLLKNASLYSSLRQDINSQTKETVDALYKYKTQKLCHDIEQDLQQALISYGENLQ
ncbi:MULTISPECIES: hypothetical protein [Pantoea]|uniref:Lipoprotein n=2 Tax=Pantoea TaxID=53335 RepID=A0AB34CJ23_9GAMM|nr:MULTISPECIES: hypothetical protein [Pantoea]KAA5930998.1 hypothetical protein F3I59_07530 [Pantoea sp. VH_8]KAA5935665.1 hypothetical protein F3I58_08725 [Pantoea sp. VH_4]KAA6125038.1 hypothetical protein F3I20_11395 [Pantoea gossypiicola]